VIAVAIAYLVPYYYTSSAERCASCHSMKKYYDSWKKSPHVVAARTCTECHVKPGLMNLVVYRLQFWSELYAEFNGVELKPFGSMLPTATSCSKAGCHSLNRETSVTGDLKIDHRLHVTRAKLRCAECHPGAVHEGITGKPLPLRKLCTRCHNQQMGNCGFCHTKKFPVDVKFEH